MALTLPAVVTVGSLRYRALLTEHRALVARIGIRVPVDAEEEAYCWAWARTCHSNRGAPSGTGEQWGARETETGWVERNYTGIRGTRAVVRALGGRVLCTPEEPDPGEDVQLVNGRPYEVKTRQAFLTPETVLSEIGGTFLQIPQFRADVPMVLVNTLQGTQDVVVCGWITRDQFLTHMFRCRFNGRDCFAVTAAVLRSVEELRA